MEQSAISISLKASISKSRISYRISSYLTAGNTTNIRKKTTMTRYTESTISFPALSIPVSLNVLQKVLEPMWFSAIRLNVVINPSFSGIRPFHAGFCGAFH
jgi:hypothetical protein